MQRVSSNDALSEVRKEGRREEEDDACLLRILHSTYFVPTFPNVRIFQKEQSPLGPSFARSFGACLGPSSSLSLQSFEQSALHQSASSLSTRRTDGRADGGVADADNADCEVRSLGKEKRPQTAARARA